jgi:hypothetical protein
MFCKAGKIIRNVDGFIMIWKEEAFFRYYLGICLEGLGKTMKNPKLDSGILIDILRHA